MRSVRSFLPMDTSARRGASRTRAAIRIGVALLGVASLAACSKTGGASGGGAGATQASATAKADAPAITVAAAADLAVAFKAVAESYEKEGGAKPTFTFGSTGLLAKQISEGAP